MNATELRDLAAGLSYVATQSKNRDLAKQAIEQLRTLRQKASSAELTELLDSYIADGEQKVGFRASDAVEIFEDSSADISKTIKVFVAYLVFVLAIAMYISLINNSLKVIGSRKN
jgi:hypothetical protein